MVCNLITFSMKRRKIMSIHQRILCLFLLAITIQINHCLASDTGTSRLSCEPILCDLIQEKITTDLGVAAFEGFKENLRRFYQMNDMQLAWFDRDGNPTSQAYQIASILAQAADKGLDPHAYRGDVWIERLNDIKSGKIKETGQERLYRLAPVDAGLSVSLMRYVTDLRMGRIDPKSVGADLNVEDKRFDLASALFEHIHDPDLKKSIEVIEPPYRAYWNLLYWLKFYRNLAGDPELASPLPVTKTVHPGEHYPALKRLQYRLKAYGDLEGSPATLADSSEQEPEHASNAHSGLYTGKTVEAVKHFQARHGLEPDGLIGKNTFAALNVPPGKRVEQIILSLERWRWLPDDVGEKLVAVNMPQFKLFGLTRQKQGVYEPEISMKVIIGKAFKRHQTPIFTGLMRYLVFSPYWNVPYSILKNELLPKIRKDPTYITKHQYEIVKRFSPDAVPLPVNDETISGLATGKYHLRQKPGPENALGPVKFIFPNRHTIFLHGTPAQNLFRFATRAFSHGCIRVEYPDILAEFVLSQKPDWDIERIREVMASQKWTRVNLSPPIPVYIFYVSAVTNSQQNIMFFRDIYGYDEKLKQAILDMGQSL